MSAINIIKLYQREACPYCQVVRKKLDLLGLSYVVVPVEKDGEDRKELKRISGQQSVPVLVDQDSVLIESGQIIDYLDLTYGDGEKHPLPSNDFGLKVKVKGEFERIVARTSEALKDEGFGILTEIDVKKTLKKKLGVDVPQQVILGACNPDFAHRALQAEEDLGLLLPCNVVVREIEEGSFLVSAINPLKLLSVVGRDDLLPVAAQVKIKMQNMIDRLSD